MTEESIIPKVTLEPSDRSPSVTVVYQPREIRMFHVSAEELETFASGNSSVHLTFFGLCFGSAITLTATWVSVKLSANTHLVFFLGSVLLGVLSLYFAVRAIADWRTSRRLIDEIKKNRVAAA